MESSAWLSIVTSCICVGMMPMLWRVLEWIWLRPKRLEKCLRDQGFLGNSYRLLYGDSNDKSNMVAQAKSNLMPQFSHDYLPRVLPFHHHTFTKYGRRCFIWNGPIPVVTISDPNLMREVFMKIDVFQKQKSNPLFKTLGTGLIQLEGEKWNNHRKLINPAFHMEKLKVMLPAFHTSVHDMIEKWDDMLKSNSSEVDIFPYLRQLSADGISRAAFGSSFEEGRRIFELISEQLLIALPLLNSVYIPGSRFLPTKANRRIMEIDKEIRTLIKGVIEKRKKAISNGEKPIDDLLGVLLQSSLQDDEQLGNNDKHKFINLSLDEVINECKIFYLAGQETTSILLVWTLILLSKHQDWQSQAREEVLTIFGNNHPDFHGLNQLKIVNMILQEVLRLYPPAVEINRTVCEDIKVQDIVLPAGVLVSLPVLLVQHDEKLWGRDAKEFNPKRFTEGISKATGGNMSFFSFGWGPRICIGSNFAMIEAKMAIAMILQRFSFELSPSYVHAPTGPGTLRPQYGAQIILHNLK